MVIGAGPIGALIATVGMFRADVVAAEIGPNRSAGVLLARTPACVSPASLPVDGGWLER